MKGWGCNQKKKINKHYFFNFFSNFFFHCYSDCNSHFGFIYLLVHYPWNICRTHSMDHGRVGSLHMPSWLEIYHVVQQQGFIYSNSARSECTRPYYLDNTVSRPICEVKQDQVRLVLAWGTSWEVQMLYIFCSFLHFFFFFFLSLFVCFFGQSGQSYDYGYPVWWRWDHNIWKNFYLRAATTFQWNICNIFLCEQKKKNY